YSIEKFLVARRLMYWQVYLHKTVVSAEVMLVEALKRAKALAVRGEPLFGSPALQRFLQTQHTGVDFRNPAVLHDFLRLDDHDIMGAVKVWALHTDVALRTLCSSIVERRTFKITLQNAAFDPAMVEQKRAAVAQRLGIPAAQAHHFVLTGSIINNAYDNSSDGIELLYKDGRVLDIAEASDNLGIAALSKPVEKWYLAWPRE
ncbi:MAG: phosphohydrolase, partial [Flavobacteriales bacterium]